jgi:hypothetical protein
MAKPIPDYTALGQTPDPRPGTGISRIDTSGLDAPQAVNRATIAAGGSLIAGAGDLAVAQDHWDSLRAEDALNKLKNEAANLSVGEDGFQTKRSSDAVTQPLLKDYGSRFTTAQNSIAAGLQNDRQRAKFAQRAALPEVQFKQDILKHAYAESLVYGKQVLEGTIAAESRTIAANSEDPYAVQASTDRIESAIKAMAQQHGWPKEEVELVRQTARDQVWQAKIDSQALTDPVGAYASIRASGTEISPKLRFQLTHQVRQLALPLEAKRIADQVISGQAALELQAGLALAGQDGIDAAVAATAPGARAARGAPGISTTGTKFDLKGNLGTWVEQASALAEKKYPGDETFRDLAVTQVRTHVNTLVAAQDGIARQAHQTLMQSALPGPNKLAPTSLDELLTTAAAKTAWVNTDAQGQRGILALLEHNARAALGSPMRESPVVMQDLFARIHLPNDDQRRIRTVGQLAPYFGRGIGRTGYDWLKKELDDQQTPEGQRLSEARKNFYAAIKPQFDKSTLLTLDERGGEDNYRFWQYTQTKEREYRAAGKDLYMLYLPPTPGGPPNPEYLGNMVPAFKRSLDEQIRGMGEALRRQSAPTPARIPGVPAAAPATAPKAPAAGNPATRLPGETIEEYRARRALQ